MGRWEVLLFCALAAVFKVAYLKWAKKLGITVCFKCTALLVLLLVISFHCCWVIAATLIRWRLGTVFYFWRLESWLSERDGCVIVGTVSVWRISPEQSCLWHGSAEFNENQARLQADHSVFVCVLWSLSFHGTWECLWQAPIPPWLLRFWDAWLQVTGLHFTSPHFSRSWLVNQHLLPSVITIFSRLCRHICVDILSF